MKKKLKMTGIILLCAVMLLSLSVYASSSADADNNVSQDASDTGSTENPESVGNPEGIENTGNGKKVYFAGPLFNQAEKDFNLEIVKVLEESGYQVFLPQRDGIEAALLEGKTEEELIKMIFELDYEEVLKADIIFMNLDGRVPDEGACVELGLAYSSGKRCYGFKTDTRAIEEELDLNPMISGCMIKIFKNFDGDQLAEEIKQYLSENEL